MNKDMTYDQIFATSRDEMEEIMKEVREKYKNDKKFEQALLNDPTETLKKEGLKLQPNISFQIIKTEEEAKLLPNNVIPLTFGDKQDLLSMGYLDKIAGGASIGGYIFNPFPPLPYENEPRTHGIFSFGNDNN